MRYLLTRISRKSIKGGQGNNGWKKGENKTVKYFFQILELAWAGRKMAKLKLQRTLWPLAGPTLYSYFHLLWLWVRKYWTEHTFHRSCLWLISLDLDIWNTPRPQVNTGQLHQEWNPDDKGGQGGRTSACDFTINHPKGESYVRYLETNMWTFSKEKNDTIDGVPTI